ncbi:MAG: hypothetical protein ACLR5J_01735 [Lachnospiraceae bacterium]
MTQKEYLQKALGAEPGFEMLIEDVYPKMEVRAFLKEGFRSFGRRHRRKKTGQNQIKADLCGMEI